MEVRGGEGEMGVSEEGERGVSEEGMGRGDGSERREWGGGDGSE